MNGSSLLTLCRHCFEPSNRPAEQAHGVGPISANSNLLQDANTQHNATNRCGRFGNMVVLFRRANLLRLSGGLCRFCKRGCRQDLLHRVSRLPGPAGFFATKALDSLEHWKPSAEFCKPLLCATHEQGSVWNIAEHASIGQEWKHAPVAWNFVLSSHSL